MSEPPLEDPRSLGSQAAVVALLRSLPKGGSWSKVSYDLLAAGSASAVWAASDGPLALFDYDAGSEEPLDEARTLLAQWRRQGWRFLTILDPDYPARLREIHQAPPFVFAAGKLAADDVAIAVVGSRKASEVGLRISRDIATALAEEKITVLSGLAAGIDASAHQAALAAGGRTVAVIGTGVARQYPAQNAVLQHEIADRGLVLSQFWPDGPPQPHNFLMRNAVMSGYGYATVVVEAGEQSGARAQARMAVEHGRPVILTDHVLQRNEWAQRMQGRPGVYIASSVDEVIAQVHSVLSAFDEVDSLMRELTSATR